MCIHDKAYSFSERTLHLNEQSFANFSELFLKTSCVLMKKAFTFAKIVFTFEQNYYYLFVLLSIFSDFGLFQFQQNI